MVKCTGGNIESTKNALCSYLDLSSPRENPRLLSALRRFKTLCGMGRVGSTVLQRYEQKALFNKDHSRSLTNEESSGDIFRHCH